MDIKKVYAKVLTGPCSINNHPAFTFSTSSDDFQRHCYTSIDNNESVLVTAHTGCGKTRAGIYAMAKYIRDNKKVVYTTPIKALSNQKYKEFNEEFVPKFLEQSGIEATIGIMTGDTKINPDADCVIMTTEILRNSLYKIGKEGDTRKESELKDSFISQIGCVIFDEVHYINDKDRGGVWEETICLLNPAITMVMLSATIDKALKFANWIGSLKQKMINLVPTSHRIIPLTHNVFIGGKLIHIIDNNYNFNRKNYDKVLAMSIDIEKKKKKHSSNLSRIGKLVSYMKEHNMLQAIFFAFSRKNCEKFALMITQKLVDDKESIELDKIFNKHMHSYEKKYIHLPQYQTIKKLIYNGVAFHHSGLIHILKEIIEILFQRGLIKVLFATETFAIGVNMPTKTVVFTELMKPTNNGRRSLLPSEYKQMSGRAGRRGKDAFGTVIILPVYNLPTQLEMVSMVLGKVPSVSSKLIIGYSFLLKNITSDNISIKEFLSSSLYHQQTVKTIQHIEQNLIELKKKVNELKKNDNSLYDEYYNIQDNSNNILNNGIVIQVNNTKKIRKIKNKLEITPNFKKNYNEYILFRQAKQELIDMEIKLNTHKSYIEDSSEPLITIMQQFGYIQKNNKSLLDLNSKDVTVKGILAAQINECNPFILTEMLIQGLFNDMKPAEIAALISIFINDFRPDDRFYITDVEGTPIINDRLKKINLIIKTYTDAEYSLNINTEIDWNIYYDYIDAVYRWTSGEDIKSIIRFLGVYEGNFIRSITKINNIVNDLKCLSNISNTIINVPIFDEIEELLMRDIVTNDSLYINN